MIRLSNNNQFFAKKWQFAAIKREINRGSIPERFLTQPFRFFPRSINVIWLAKPPAPAIEGCIIFPSAILLAKSAPEKIWKKKIIFLECDGNERKMKSEPAQLPVPPPRKNAEKSKKSPKTTLDPKNAQLFIENFVNQVTTSNVIYNYYTPFVIPKTTFYAILMLIASYLSPAVFLHFLKNFGSRSKFPSRRIFQELRQSFFND